MFTFTAEAALLLPLLVSAASTASAVGAVDDVTAEHDEDELEDEDEDEEEDEEGGLGPTTPDVATQGPFVEDVWDPPCKQHDEKNV